MNIDFINVSYILKEMPEITKFFMYRAIEAFSTYVFIKYAWKAFLHSKRIYYSFKKTDTPNIPNNEW